MANVMSRGAVEAPVITCRGSDGSYRTSTVGPRAAGSPCWCGSKTRIRSPRRVAKLIIDDPLASLRVAVTGKDVGFGTFETLEIVGREKCLARKTVS